MEGHERMNNSDAHFGSAVILPADIGNHCGISTYPAIPQKKPTKFRDKPFSLCHKTLGRC